MTHIALVTGGTTGLGAAIAARLAKDGHTVVVTYYPGDARVIAGLPAWKKAMTDAGFAVKAYPVDVSNFDSCATLAADVLAGVGPVDILVNNAGITQDATFRKMTKEQWDAVMHTNLDSVFNMTKHFIESMVNHAFGRVISISSVNGQKGQRGQANYAAAKAGIIGFTKSVADEVAKKGVTVNAVAPGYVGTDMVMKIDPDVLAGIVAKVPAGRLARPEEIAGIVSFLASEDASFVTGACIDANGGLYYR